MISKGNFCIPRIGISSLSPFVSCPFLPVLSLTQMLQGPFSRRDRQESRRDWQRRIRHPSAPAAAKDRRPAHQLHPVPYMDIFEPCRGDDKRRDQFCLHRRRKDPVSREPCLALEVSQGNRELVRHPPPFRQAASQLAACMILFRVVVSN